MGTLNKLLQSRQEKIVDTGNKVTVVGVGQVGMATVFSLLTQILKYNPNVIQLIMINPMDVLTYVSWKISGLPTHRVIGSGTNLDSSTFGYLLSQKLGVASTSRNAYSIGEHGDSSVPGVRLRDLKKNIGLDGDDKNWKDIHAKIVASAYEVIMLKRYTSWAIDLYLTQITRPILTNASTVHTVTTCVKGEHGIKDVVFLTLRCVLGRNGVLGVVRQPLTDKKRQQLLQSASIMAQLQAKIKV